jgi:hypothetical protein
MPDGGASAMPSPARKGRGAVTNPPVRYESTRREPWDDGWGTLAAEFAELPPLPTELIREKSKTALAWNESPDIGFDRSLNPYLLLCPPLPRLCRHVARPRFRDAADVQAEPA